MKFHLFHTYGNWEEYTTEIMVGLPNAASELYKQKYLQMRLKRYCLKCNFAQIRIPREAIR